MCVFFVCVGFCCVREGVGGCVCGCGVCVCVSVCVCVCCVCVCVLRRCVCVCDTFVVVANIGYVWVCVIAGSVKVIEN